MRRDFATPAVAGGTLVGMRRFVVRILLVLLLGVLSTIGSAWALGAWMPMANYPRRVNYDFIADGRPWSVVQIRERGIWTLWWSEYNAGYVTAPNTAPDPGLPTTAEGWMAYAREDRAGLAFPSRDGLPWWGSFASGPLPSREVAHGSDMGFGWPLPALWYRIDGGMLGNMSFATGIDGGLLLTPEASLDIRLYHHRAIPLRAYWPGLVADSALFSALWSLVLFAPGRVRKFLRRRRGQCAACGYDLRGIGEGARCPECGGVAGGGLPAQDKPTLLALAGPL